MITFRDITDAGAADAYFAGAAMTADERAGRWIGLGCPALGFAADAPVARADLRAALDGITPLGPIYERKSASRRPGYDFCFSADKSLSVAALCLGPDTAAIVRRAWDSALRDTWHNYADPLAAFSAKHGVDKSAHALVSAEFTHFASRHADPHLHSHIVTLNSSRDPLDDDRLRNLDPRRLMAARKSLDSLFNHNLAHRLRAGGLAAELSTGGRKAVLPAVPELIRAAFSRAQDAIRKAVLDHPAPSDRVSAPQWAAIINDRIRPEKPSTPDFSDKIPSAERDDINAAIRDRRTLSPTSSTHREDDDDRPTRIRLASAIAAHARKISSAPSRESFVACIAEVAVATPLAGPGNLAIAADYAHASLHAAPTPKSPATLRDERLRLAAETRRKQSLLAAAKKKKSAALRAALEKRRQESASAISNAQRLAAHLVKLARQAAARRAARAKTGAASAAKAAARKATDASKALIAKLKRQRDLASKAARNSLASKMRP